MPVAAPHASSSTQGKEGLISRLLPVEEAPPRAIAWEADTAGTIRWVDATPREALIGRNILQDGSWRSSSTTPRPHISGVKIEIPGTGRLAGAWLFSGEACFDPHVHAFRGYRGRAWRQAVAEQPCEKKEAIAAEALRGLVHEFRTPLNAIVGFGELIDGQISGAAAEVYRPRTTRIATQAARLVSAIDELDAAARIAFFEREAGKTTSGSVIVSRLRALSRHAPCRKGASLDWQDRPGLPSTALSPEAFDHLVRRLITLCLGYAAEDEHLSGTVQTERANGARTMCLAADLPAALRGYSFLGAARVAEPDGDWPFAPELGLSFAGQLLSSLSVALGGSLSLQDGSIRLHLAAA